MKEEQISFYGQQLVTIEKTLHNLVNKNASLKERIDNIKKDGDKTPPVDRHSFQKRK